MIRFANSLLTTWLQWYMWVVNKQYSKANLSMGRRRMLLLLCCIHWNPNVSTTNKRGEQQQSEAKSDAWPRFVYIYTTTNNEQEAVSVLRANQAMESEKWSSLLDEKVGVYSYSKASRFKKHESNPKLIIKWKVSNKTKQ